AHARDLPCVVAGRYKRDQERPPDERLNDGGGLSEVVVIQGRDSGHDVERRGNLAVNRWPESPWADRQIHHRYRRDDRDVTADDQDREPERQPAGVAETRHGE